MNDLWLLGGALVLLGGAARVVESSWFKGWMGELKVRFGLRWLLDPYYYRVINDVTLPTEDGTTQIDHVVICTAGIFVLETKNMSGWIFGREREANWTQQIYRHKQRFQNPLRQNYKHTQTLIETLDIRPETVKPIVAFVGGARLRTDMPPNVVTGWGFVGYIRSHTERLLTVDEAEEVADRIAAAQLAPGWKTHRQHVRHVKKLHEERAKPV